MKITFYAELFSNLREEANKRGCHIPALVNAICNEYFSTKKEHINDRTGKTENS